MGFSKFLSYGNRVDLDEIDLLPYLAEDPETRVGALYIESVADGRAFIFPDPSPPIYATLTRPLQSNCLSFAQKHGCGKVFPDGLASDHSVSGVFQKNIKGALQHAGAVCDVHGKR